MSLKTVLETGLETVLGKIETAVRDRGPGRKPVLVAVSKTFDAKAIAPVLAAGQRVFGENRVQEALGKWPGLKSAHEGIELHLIGPLQTNKVRDAVALFDVIETVDREKLARALAREMGKQGRTLPVFVQVNIGDELQKSGVAIEKTGELVALCRELGLNVIGLMALPPANRPPGPYFAQLADLAKKEGLDGLSMGMSADFEQAILLGATHVRIGSAIFGGR
ncbi:MAG: YggS family pyridoxal phosphate-dependent enzyme [Alphaproteobacteria bacterium]|nr:YggS family pyridoxal phosphate-dependent enzyme [Alphaproteobacteria bacterium]